jgi:hypothetical protein
VGTSSILGSSESIFTLDSSFSYFVFGWSLFSSFGVSSFLCSLDSSAI